MERDSGYQTSANWVSQSPTSYPPSKKRSYSSARSQPNMGAKRKGVKGKGVRPSIKQVVAKQILKMAEKKFFTISNAGYSILNASTNAVLPLIENITPFMAEGAATYQRIGDKVRVASYKLSVRVASINQAASVSDFWSVKFFVLRVKDSTASPGVSDMTNFLYVDNNGTTQTVSSWVTTDPANSLLKVNEDYFTVYAESPNFKIANANVDGFYNNDYSCERSWTTTLPKAPKSLHFNQSVSSYPTNMGLYLICCLTADTTTVGSEFPFVAYNMRCDYTDL